jgi:hypothetical protein
VCCRAWQKLGHCGSKKRTAHAKVFIDMVSWFHPVIHTHTHQSFLFLCYEILSCLVPQLVLCRIRPSPFNLVHVHSLHAQYFARFFCSRSARSTALILAASTKSLRESGTAHHTSVVRSRLWRQSHEQAKHTTLH